MIIEQDILLYLIRLGIGTDVENSIPFKEVDWKFVIELSIRQGVAAIAVDGLQRLYSKFPEIELKLDSPELKYDKYKWFKFVLDTEKRNMIVSKKTNDLYLYFNNAGFRSCVLKGQGIAQLYPVPAHRVPGDIDLWVEGDRDDLLEFVIKQGIKIGNIDSKHFDIEIFDNVPVEIHSLPSYSFDPVCWSRLKRWSSKQISYQVTLFDDNVGFAFPSISFNLVYILHHIYRHVFNEGVGLRQVTDYACVLKQSSEFDRDGAWDAICMLKMKHFASGFMWIMKVCYNIDDSKLLCSPNKKEGLFLLNEFWCGGSFGRYDNRHQINHSGGTIILGLSQLKRNLSFVFHYPNEVLWSPFWKIWHFFWMKRYASKYLF